MAAVIKTLTDPTSTDSIYPKTKMEAVYDNDNNRLDTELSSIVTNLGSPSSASSVTGDDAFTKINTLNSDKLNKTNVASVSKSNLASGNNFISYPSGFDRSNSIIVAIAINDVAYGWQDYLSVVNMDVSNIVVATKSSGIGEKVTIWLLKYT